MRRARVLAERQGIEHKSPKVACLFDGKPLGAAAQLFCGMAALAVSPPPPLVLPGNAESIEAFKARREPRLSLLIPSPSQHGNWSNGVSFDLRQIGASTLLSSQFRSTFYCWRADQTPSPVKSQGQAEPRPTPS